MSIQEHGIVLNHSVYYIALIVGASTDSARGKEYFSSEFNKIKFNWRLFRKKWINIIIVFYCFLQ